MLTRCHGESLSEHNIRPHDSKLKSAPYLRERCEWVILGAIKSENGNVEAGYDHHRGKLGSQ